jgi:hypothetical protein
MEVSTVFTLVCGFRSHFGPLRSGLPTLPICLADVLQP